MKTAWTLTATLLLQVAVAAQQGAPPAGGAQPGTAPPAGVPPGNVPPGTAPPGNVPPGSVPPGSVPPGSVFNPTNPLPGRPFPAATNPAGLPGSLPATGRRMATNEPPATARNAATAPGAGATNALVDFSVTNTLSTMAPVQARAVIEVHGGLEALQNLAINIGGVQNVQQIARTPQVQQHVQQVSRQIGALAQGEARPSQDILDRLTLDLFRAFTRARPDPEVQLVLAVVLNQACNSANLSPTQVNSAINNAMGALQTAGVPMALAHPVTCDLHSVAFELQPGLAQ